jgi:hypothetical protein
MSAWRADPGTLLRKRSKNLIPSTCGQLDASANSGFSRAEKLYPIMTIGLRLPYLSENQPEKTFNACRTLCYSFNGPHIDITCAKGNHKEEWYERIDHFTAYIGQKTY